MVGGMVKRSRFPLLAVQNGVRIRVGCVSELPM